MKRRTLVVAGLLAAAGIAAPIVAFAAFLRPARADRLEVERREEEIHSQVLRARGLPDPRATDEGYLLQLRSEAIFLDKTLSSLQATEALSRTIRSLALKEKLIIRAETPFEPAAAKSAPGDAPTQEERAADGSQRFRKKLAVAGDFGALRRFIGSVEGLPELLRLSGVSIKRPPRGAPLEIEVEVEVVRGVPDGGNGGGNAGGAVAGGRTRGGNAVRPPRSSGRGTIGLGLPRDGPSGRTGP